MIDFFNFVRNRDVFGKEKGKGDVFFFFEILEIDFDYISRCFLRGC